MSLDCGRKLELTERSWGTRSKSTQKFPVLAFFFKARTEIWKDKRRNQGFLAANQLC